MRRSVAGRRRRGVSGTERRWRGSTKASDRNSPQIPRVALYRTSSTSMAPPWSEPGTAWETTALPPRRRGRRAGPPAPPSAPREATNNNMFSLPPDRGKAEPLSGAGREIGCAAADQRAGVRVSLCVPRVVATRAGLRRGTSARSIRGAGPSSARTPAGMCPKGAPTVSCAWSSQEPPVSPTHAGRIPRGIVPRIDAGPGRTRPVAHRWDADDDGWPDGAARRRGSRHGPAAGTGSTRGVDRACPGAVRRSVATTTVTVPGARRRGRGGVAHA